MRPWPILLTLDKRILASLFQSVTPRTAGFNTADLPAMTGSSKAVSYTHLASKNASKDDFKFCVDGYTKSKF